MESNSGRMGFSANTPPPRWGEHTEQVLKRLLRFTPAEIARLKEANLV